MKKSSFKHYDLSQSTRKNLTISKFGGVDYSTPRFLVDSSRAIDLLNYIYKNGIVQKRNGIEEIYHVKSFKYIKKDFDDGFVDDVVKENGVNFNGLWKFVAEDGKEHFIAHVGKLLYEIKDFNTSQMEMLPIIFNKNSVKGNDGLYYSRCYEFLDNKSFAFVGGNKFWFLGGNKYMCLRFLKDQYGESVIQFFPVENSLLTPIPTTSISITYKNSIVSGRAQLDKANLLTMWRKNKMLSGTSKNETEKTKTTFYEYTLDAPLICKDTKKDMANFSLIIEERGTIDNG